MNRIYRSIWSDRTGTFVAASENAKSNGRKSSPGSSALATGARFVRKGLMVSISLTLAFGSNVYAGPTGGVVSAGSASITAGAGKTTINQASQNAAINWQSFSIGQKESVQFVQPNSSSVALNRVLGSDPSNILGSLTANGKVFLVNPNGILFGQGAQVNVGGLIASSLNISDSDFMAGKYNFAGAGTGAVLNQGTINAEGGYVALLGANVSNEGVISARLGTVVLAAGNAMTLDVAGDGLLNVTLNQGVANALAQNGGLIQANGGQVLLTAQAAGSLLQSAVNNTGVIQAQTIDTRNGAIRLMGDMQSGTVNISGTLDASGKGTGQTGGSVTATGQHVGLFGGRIDASGDAGGGTVLIGGGYQGKNPALQNAAAAYMSADSTISADAITNGNGGTVVLWSADSTRAYGSITARGGAQGGAGGLIETSGHWLDVAGIKVNASAPNGTRGMWLLDPADVTIGAATSDATLTANVFSPNSSVNSATVGVAELRTALEAGGGTDVSITTTNTGTAGVPASGLGNITLSSDLTWTPTNPATLTLNAAGDVNINAAISATKGNLVVCCGQDVNVRAPITTVNGSILLGAGRDVNIVRSAATLAFPQQNLTAITTTDGNLAICAGRNVNLGNTFNGAALITLTTGSTTLGQDLRDLGVTRGLTLSAGNAATGPGPAGGTVIIAAGTILTVTGPAGISPINIFYNPTSYTTPTDYSTFFATGNGDPFTQYMLVYPVVNDKTFLAGDTTATFSGAFKSTGTSGTVPGTVTLVTTGATANFDTDAVGADKTVTYSGLNLTQGATQTGGTGVNFALPVSCCAPRVGKTTGTITAATVATTTTTAATTTTTAATTTTTAATTTTTAATTTTTAATTTTTAATTTTTAATTTTTAATTTTTAAPTTTTTVATTTTTTLPPIVPPIVPPIIVPPIIVPPEEAPFVPPLVPPLVPPTTLQYVPGLPVSVLGTGVRMPPVLVVAPPPVIVPPPLVVPPEAPPVYVPPERPRRPERN